MNRYTTVIDLMRHGEPEGGRMFRGTKDDPLSPTGWQQMRSVAAGFSPWQTVVSSPLRRCREFAAEVAGQLGLTLDVDPLFREIGFGDWEGLTAEQVEAGWPGALAEYWRMPEAYTPPGGEPLVRFDARIEAAWDGLLERHRGRHMLLVCHGGVIRACLRQVLGLPLANLWRIDVPYAAPSRVRIHGSDGEPVPIVECLNGGFAGWWPHTDHT